MSTFRLPTLALLATLVGVWAAAGGAANAEPPPGPPQHVWIYRDVPSDVPSDRRTESERAYAPFGFMPAERVTQISVNPSFPLESGKPELGTCIRYAFKLNRAGEWLGVYTLIDGKEWGTKPGLNIPKLLGTTPDTPLALRFEARGKGVVTFKIGGVSTGAHPSSLPLGKELGNGQTRLTETFQEYTIGPLRADQLVNLVDPFCVVVSGFDNGPTPQVVAVDVDNIRIERFERPRKAAQDWRRRLGETVWVTYTPLGFDPTQDPPVPATREAIDQDLAALRDLADAADVPQLGVITYGCNLGLDQVMPSAARHRLRVILGVWDVQDEQELARAEQILADPAWDDPLVACCVGNETLTFRRATLEQVQASVTRLRRSAPASFPFTTTEIAQAYGKPELWQFDFALVNAHALFASVFDAASAVEWTEQQIAALLKAAPADAPVLIKEAGWPAGPAPALTDQQQADFFLGLLQGKAARRANICIFDAFPASWKSEPVPFPGHGKLNVGPHWQVLFDADRQPRPHAIQVLRQARAAREQAAASSR